MKRSVYCKRRIGFPLFSAITLNRDVKSFKKKNKYCSLTDNNQAVCPRLALSKQQQYVLLFFRVKAKQPHHHGVFLFYSAFLLFPFF